MWTDIFFKAVPGSEWSPVAGVQDLTNFSGTRSLCWPFADKLRCMVNIHSEPQPSQTAQPELYLSADSVRCPERHEEGLAVATDVVTVVEDGVLGTEEYSRSTMRQIPAVWEEERQVCDRTFLHSTTAHTERKDRLGGSFPPHYKFNISSSHLPNKHQRTSSP